MRLLLLGLNFVIGLSITLPPSVGYAATLTKSAHKNVKKTNNHKIARDPGDLWDRIRAGMRIPHPVAVQQAAIAKSSKDNLDGLADVAGLSTENQVNSPEIDKQTDVEQSTESNLKIRPHKALPPVNRYTELGAKLLGGAKMSSAKIIDCTAQPSTASRQPLRNKAGIAEINERIKASMESNAQARKHTVILVSAKKPAMDAEENPAAMPVTPPEPPLADKMRREKSINPCANHPEMRPYLVNGGGSVEQLKMMSATNANMQADPLKLKQSNIEERINKFVLAYSQNPGFLKNVADRAQPYLYYIVDSLSKQSLPLELALLPIVESAYQATVQSPKKAAGLWQFIPMTGKDYDLEQNKDYDERMDVAESTQAAIKFLSGLKDHYRGDWLLALAAYNAGQGTVDNAISQNKSEGMTTDYWSLRLPDETQNYVPRLLALAKIFARPGAYGIKLSPIKNEPFFVEVRLGREFDVNYLTRKDMDSVAQLASLSPEQFSSLNPGYLNKTLPDQDSFKFLLPERNARLLKDRLSSIEKFVSAPVGKNSVTEGESQLIVENTPKTDVELPGSTLSLLSDLVANNRLNAPVIPAPPLLSLSIESGPSLQQKIRIADSSKI